MKSERSKEDYIRDHRSPIPKNENVSRIMSANRGKETSPEVILRKGMWGIGIRGYRKNWKKAPGRPDIAFPKRKIAIFVNGCYWHRCPTCKYPLPKTNTKFWREKFKRNKIRDKKKSKLLHDMGWKVLVIWECNIKKDLNKEIKKIKQLLK